MHVLLWILQVAAGLFYFAGGAYKAFNGSQLAAQMPALPPALWSVLGVVEMVCAVLLVVPATGKWLPHATPTAAAVLAVETLALAALYARYSLAVAATNPLVWAVALGLLVGFVAWGRYALRPLA